MCVQYVTGGADIGQTFLFMKEETGKKTEVSGPVKLKLNTGNRIKLYTRHTKLDTNCVLNLRIGTGQTRSRMLWS